MENRFALAVLPVVMTTLSLAAPLREYQCTRLPDNHVGCGLPLQIQAEMSEPTCHTQWSINNTSVASYDGREIEFIHPVIEATNKELKLETCYGSLVFDISCFKSAFIEQLRFSCPQDHTPLTTQGTSSGVSPFISPYLLLTTGVTIIFG